MAGKKYFRVKLPLGWSAQQYFVLARSAALWSTPILIVALALLFQPFSETVSSWTVKYGWYALVGAYSLIFLPQVLFIARRNMENKRGFSTWLEEDRLENVRGQRLIIVDYKSGIVLRVSGQKRDIPASLTETRDARIAKVLPQAEMVTWQLANPHRRSRSDSTVRLEARRTIDDVVSQISPLD